MADKKNIVIKVKYPNAAKKSENETAAVHTITEWDVKKIGGAAVLALVFLMSLIYWVGRNNQEIAKEQQAETKQETLPVAGQSDTQAANPVVRSQLAYKIVDNEPESEIKLPLKISKKDSTWIYYFVELKDMKGKSVIHEWLLNGDLVSRKKVNISDDRWRTASKQVFSYTSETNWTVRLVDDKNNVIDEKHFDVVFE